MPAYNSKLGATPNLSPLMRLLMERTVASKDLPMPGMMGMSPVFRGPGDLAKVLGENVSKVPAAPDTGAKVGGAFGDYLAKLAQLLQKSPPKK